MATRGPSLTAPVAQLAAEQQAAAAGRHTKALATGSNRTKTLDVLVRHTSAGRPLVQLLELTCRQPELVVEQVQRLVDNGEH